MQLSRRLFVQSLTAVSAFAVLPPKRKLLFVVNEVAEYQGLPAGSVESYDVSGPRKLISRRSLSLSATLPKSLAISPDGSFVVVAAYGGGIYNVLPVSPAGEIGEVSQVLKAIGSSVHPEHQTTSHPHSLVFHPSGKFLLATDLGADRITVFSVLNGRIASASYVNAPPGSGPAKLRIDQYGSNVTVWHELKPSVAYYQFDAQSGRLT
jgi:6-phosphogluconolactonase (cycloisomerase 2 family)